MENLVDNYIKNRLSKTDNNYPRVLGNVQALLEHLLQNPNYE